MRGAYEPRIISITGQTSYKNPSENSKTIKFVEGQQGYWQ